MYLFERVGEQNGADIHSYVGEYKHIDDYWEEDYDTNEKIRDAIRFKLSPVGGNQVDLQEEEVEALTDEELFTRAKEATERTTQNPGSGSAGRGDNYTRSDLVKDFAKRVADGICQGCDQDTPFIDQKSEPYLEVHHLHRRSDGGMDDPENVIALCPNCHRRRHYGRDGDEFNQLLIEKAAEIYQRFL